MSAYSPGGLVRGEAVNLSVEGAGRCANGHDLVRIQNGPVEHLVSLPAVRGGDLSALYCEALP